MPRRLENYVKKYGPEVGPKFCHVLQSQAAHAGVSARLRRKLSVLEGRTPSAKRPAALAAGLLPLFPEVEAESVPADLVTA